MVAVANKRPKAIIVTKNAVDQASAFFQKLPDKPKQNFSLREAVDQLREQIQSTLAKGYSYDDVAAMLKRQGIDISASTLKNYVPSGKRQTSKGKPTSIRTRGRRSKQAQSDELTVAQSAAPSSPATSTVTSELKNQSKASGKQAQISAPAHAIEPAPAKRGRGRAQGATTAAAKSQTTPATNPETHAKPAKSRVTRSSNTAKPESTAKKASSTSKATPSATRGRRKASS